MLTTVSRDVIDLYDSGLGSNVCSICRGRGNLICRGDDGLEWFDCPACDGGARISAGPSTIRVHAAGKDDRRRV